MRHKAIVLTVLAAVASGAFVASAARGNDGHDSNNFRIFGDTPLTSVRGVAAAGNPWMTDPSRVRLDDAGRLDIKIRGLVVAAGLNSLGNQVPAAVVGTNPVSTIRISVVWMTPGGPFFSETGPLPLDPNGNLSTRAQLTVAPPAGAERPIILVRAGGNPGTGPFIASSDYVSDLGSAHPDQND
jgi:hypothetical protein